MTRVAVTLLLIFAMAAFYVYTYNSGYGFDACEYLVIGRSLLNGFSLSSFILTKGWAMYVVTAAALALTPEHSHAWIAFFITLLFAVAVWGTYWVGRRLFGGPIAVVAALLVTLCGMFMEMNFLEPEILVYLTGILSIYFLEYNGSRKSAVRCALAGLCLGAGFAFKAVSLFYWAGMSLYVALTPDEPIAVRLRKVILITSGLVIAIVIPLCYFAATGQLDHYIEWSIVFPLWQYPRNTFWLSKLFTKLLWFFTLLAGAALLGCTPRLRRNVFANRRVALVLWMGILSLLSLLKTQASHYVFPGAALLSFFIAQVLYSWWSFRLGRQTTRVWLPIIALIVVIVSALLYRPSAFERFVSRRDFSGEDRVRIGLGRLALPQDRVLFLHGGACLYWLADRYPNVPFVQTHVQTTYLLFPQPELLTRALDDPRLKVVEFDPSHLEFDDPRFLASQHHRDLIESFSERLRERFTRIHDPDVPLSLWVRPASVPMVNARVAIPSGF